MISRRIIAAVALLCAFAAPAYAQSTKAQINTAITTTFIDNNVGAITPAGLRSVTSSIVNSIMPTAPVVSGNLACFSGTTGLLQDCGVAPATVALVVGTTPITGGTTTRVLFDNGGFLGEYQVSGTGSVCMTTSCVMATPNLGTPSAVVLTNGTGMPTTGLTGTLQAAQEPAHTNDCTNTAGSLALTCLSTNGVAFTATATAATGQIPATATNDNAAAGKVGEIITATVAIGSAVSLTTNVAANVTSISLTAGDWDVTGSVFFSAAAGTSITRYGGSLETTTNTFSSTPGQSWLFIQPAFVLGSGNNVGFASGPFRVSVSGTTSVFLTTLSTFTVSTFSAYGFIRARRVR